MRLGFLADGTELHHDIREEFGELLRTALRGHRVAVALGPMYGEDPATQTLQPFVRSAAESGWTFDERVIPEWAYERARRDRLAQVVPMDPQELDRWTRAGLVLEIASRWGIPKGGRRMHVRWNLRGTVTGRFGVESGSPFNPMVIPEKDRHAIHAAKGFGLATIDFNAMDLRSMISLIPDMVEWYEDAEDLHQRTADIMDIDRDEAKAEIFVHAYGGRSKYRDRFLARMPYLSQLHEGEHGDGARRVQTQSARAFRGALSEALPLLVTDELRPLFTVHDELNVEYLSGGVRETIERTGGLIQALERGASQTIGVPYRVKCRVGRTYEETKRDG